MSQYNRHHTHTHTHTHTTADLLSRQKVEASVNVLYNHTAAERRIRISLHASWSKSPAVPAKQKYYPAASYSAPTHRSSLLHMQQGAGPLPYLSCSNALVPSPTSHAAMRWSPPLPHMQQGTGPLLYLTCSKALVPSPTSHAARHWSPPLPLMQQGAGPLPYLT